MSVIAPPASSYCPIVDQASAQQLVLYNYNPNLPLEYPQNTVWVWSGGSQTWTTGNNPIIADRLNPSMFYDGANVILFGGQHSAGTISDPETFNGSVWTQNQLLTPSPRAQALSTYISGSKSVVLWAGITLNHPLTQTYVYTPNNQLWTLQHPTTTPPWRTQSQMASDGNVGILFSGWSVGETEIVEDGVWVWANGQWSFQTTINTPPARAGHGLVFDQSRGVFLLFGGYNSAGLFFKDLHELTLSTLTWRPIGSNLLPTARAGMSLCYDATQQNTVMWGGWDGKNTLNDTFVWDGFVWHLIPPIF